MNSLPATGFPNPSEDAAHSFRSLLTAMSHPASIQPLTTNLPSVAKLNPAASLIALTLVDHESTVWLDDDLDDETVKQFFKFNCSAPLTKQPNQAMLAFFSHCPSPQDLSGFNKGNATYPDASTTLIIQVKSLNHGNAVTLTGPGIQTEQALKVDGLNKNFWPWFKTNQTIFPLGNDVILAAPDCLTALPRTTKIAEAN
ncbi:MAG: phosphonate C-P lyase system protein PhnH [Alphaproteobacteria bacterium]|nr:phosphonate C-P lyase system protein PhnH [Alphaproteobacteria bacterium]